MHKQIVDPPRHSDKGINVNLMNNGSLTNGKTSLKLSIVNGGVFNNDS